MRRQRGRMKRFGMIVASFAVFSWAALAHGTNTGQNSNPGAKKQELTNATQTVEALTGSNKIPKSLIDSAKCIAVIPSLTRGAFIAGGEHGAGVVSCRDSKGWSAPAFISISGGSIGLQAGASSSKVVLLMNKQGEQDLLNGNFQLTANAVAAGPTGNSYNASAGWKTPVLSYQQSHGLFAGASIQGSTIQVDHSTMQKVYGFNASAQKVLSGSVQVPQQARPFVSALRQSTQMG
jgi:lipid-binding SYLF domain-containing protein